MADFNIFGSAPDYLGGLLGQQGLEDLQKKALTTGLINTAIGYIAQPKNQRLGGALPYIGRALQAGQTAAQGVYDQGLKNWEMQQKLEQLNARKNVLSELQTSDPELYRIGTAFPNAVDQLIAQKYKAKTSESPIGKLEPQNFTPESWADFVNSNYDTTKLRAINKPAPQGPTAAQEYEWAGNDPAKLKFLRDRWTAGVTASAAAQAPYKETEQAATEAATQYKYSRPQNIAVTAGGKTYYFKDQASANAFKQKAGVK